MPTCACGFGAIGERLWISPRFHRVHHAIGIGHEIPVARSDTGRPQLRRAAALVGHALSAPSNFEHRYDATGIRDQVEPDADGRVRDYGRGFWAQQWLGLRAPGRQGLRRRRHALALSSAPMRLLLDSFWRAVAYCLHPRVIVLSLLPLGLMVALALGLGYFYWDAAVARSARALECVALAAASGAGSAAARATSQPRWRRWWWSSPPRR